MSTKKTVHVIRLDRDVADHILPRDFYDILVHRFFPVISLTYLSTVVGISAGKGDFLHFLFADPTSYVMGLFVVLWVSGPAIIWILLHESVMYRHVADLWYKILAGIMVITIALSFFLFPEASVYGLRQYFALSVPVFVIIYYFFIKGGLPPVASYPLNAIGVCALIYGAAVNLIF